MRRRRLLLVMQLVIACGGEQRGTGTTTNVPGDGGAAGRGGASSLGGLGGAGTLGSGGIPVGGAGGVAPRPAWDPVLPLGDVGWRGSTTPFCSEHRGSLRPELWSSPEAVYALITFDVNLWADAIGETLYRNDGTGWVSIHEITSTAQADTRLANAVVGLSTGSVALVGGECPVLMVDSAGASSCALAEPVRPIAAAGADDRLYILADDETETARSLMELAGGTWRTILTLTPQEMGVALAVNGDTVVLAGQTLRAGSVTAGTVVPLPNIPALLYGDVWLVSPNELVARDTVGQLVRFDGVQWTIVDSGTGDRITGIWGAPDGAVYFVTQHQFGRLVGDQVTLFTTPEANDANHYFADIWGNSSSEVFVAVNDRDYDIYECGVSFLLWFDGVQLHEF